MEYIQVILLDLPVTVSGLTIMNRDDSYTIFINARLNHDMQCKEYDRQIGYINNHDYDNMYDSKMLEHISYAG